MPWIYKHECRMPATWKYGRLGWLIGAPRRPAGSVWECPRCRRRWELVGRYLANGQPFSKWIYHQPPQPHPRQAPPGRGGQSQ